MKKRKNGLQLSPDITNSDRDQTDICSSINTPDRIDLFEGLNLDEICVPPQKKKQEDTSSEGQEGENETGELFDLNPLDGIDLEDISVNPQFRPVDHDHKEPSSKEKGDVVNHILVPDPENDNGSEDNERQERKNEDYSLATRASLPLTVRKKEDSIDPIVEKAYGYAELTQIREILFASFTKTQGNILLVASPHDNTGTSLLVAALGYNIACSCQKSVLLVDCNMRRAGLHNFFKLPQSHGFTELVKDDLPWQSVVKSTGFDHLHIITAGSRCTNLSDYLCDCHVPNLLNQVRDQFDLIIVDTSPVLAPNRNNVNIVSLTSVVDYFLLVVKKAGSTKSHLKETQNIIEAGNGRIDSIVLNEYDPEKKKMPYQKL